MKILNAIIGLPDFYNIQQTKVCLSPASMNEQLSHILLAPSIRRRCRLIWVTAYVEHIRPENL